MARPHHRRAPAVLAALAIALAGAGAGCGEDEETTTPATTEPATGATGSDGGEAEDNSSGGAAGKPDKDDQAKAQREGTGSGLEENISGADISGTDTPEGGESTTGDSSAGE